MYFLPKKCRLRKAEEFTAVLRYKRNASYDSLQIYAMPNHLNCSRLGLIVAKKVVRRAVIRNWVKRVLREVFRKNMNQQSQDTEAIDWIIRLRRPVSINDSAKLIGEAQTLTLRLLQQCQK